MDSRSASGPDVEVKGEVLVAALKISGRRCVAYKVHVRAIS